MLMELKSYLERHRQATIADLSHHFRVAPDALRGMLEHWIRKGAVVRHDFAPTCASGCASGHCGSCATSGTFEIYEWTAQSGGRA
jgi:hypothetical protein